MRKCVYILLLTVIMTCEVKTAFAKTDTVRLVGMTFVPAYLYVKPGTTVIWINTTGILHSVTSGTDCNPDGKWNSGYLQKGQIFRYTFKTEGKYPYFCIPHCLSGMKGMVFVSAAPGKKITKHNPEGKGKQPEKLANTAENENDTAEESPVYTQIFADTRIINAESVETLGKHIMDVRITHRFGNIMPPIGGYHYFFGLDDIQDVRLGVEYGITDNLMIGLARSKGEYDNTVPQTQIRELYEAMAKYRILRQKTDGSMPISLTLHGNIVFTSMLRDTARFSEANFQHESDRFSFVFQAMAARQFNKHLALQLMPVYVRRNWARSDIGDLPDIFALGIGGKYMFNEHLGIVADYFHPFSQYRQAHSSQYFDPLAVGLLINTGGHEFTINFSNSTGTIENTFIPYTIDSWLKGQFRLGFSISRKFMIRKKVPKTQMQDMKGM